MANVTVKSEAINGFASEFRFKFMDYVYSSNDPEFNEKDDLTYIVELNELVNDILREVACIESERDEAKHSAEFWKKLYERSRKEKE